MIHKMKLQEDPFKRIKNGTKDIEMRLYDEKRRKIKENDFIEFTNVENQERLTVKVVKLHIFDSFENLYNNFDKLRIGYNIDDNARAEDMEMYYSKEDIKQNGVVGIEIKVI